MENQKPKSRTELAKKNAQKYFLKPGKIYGNWKTIRQVKIQTSACMETRWECEYIPTGEIKLQKGHYLAKFQTGEEQQKHLEELVENNQHQMGFRNFLYTYSKRNAATRGHEHLLTFEEHDKLIQQPCYYCGALPRPATPEQIKKRGNPKQPTFYYNGIDRINPEIGYNLDNCVPCCPVCNYMKHTLQKDDFYKQIIKIYNHLDLGSTTIENTSEKDGSE